MMLMYDDVWSKDVGWAVGEHVRSKKKKKTRSGATSSCQLSLRLLERLRGKAFRPDIMLASGPMESQLDTLEPAVYRILDRLIMLCLCTPDKKK